jgi:Flp pilus assembly protein TadG
MRGLKMLAQFILGEERGAMIITLALFSPLAILFMAYVIDLGDTFNHKRGLQVEADAAALSTGLTFNSCFVNKALGNTSIYQTAGQYGGVSTVTAPSSVSAGPTGTIVSNMPMYNPQVGSVTTQSNLHALINSQTYYNQSSPVDSDVPSSNADPCTAEMADVKVTETNLPWYFQAFSVPNINAHARVQLMNVAAASNVVPFAVANTAPSAVAVYVVNEDVTPGQAGYILNTVHLTDQGPATPAQGELWSNTGAPAAVAVTKPHMGIIVAVSGNKNDTTCGHTDVTCFGEFSGGGSLVHIQGYSLAGTGTYNQPKTRSVTLSTTTCANGSGLDAYYSTAAVTCTFTISAKLDLGSTPNPQNWATVTPVVGGTTQTAMTYNTSTGLWSGAATLPASQDSDKIDLQVKCNMNGSGSPCSGGSTTATCTTDSSLCDVHRADSADAATAAGVYSADVVENGLSQQNSFEICETQDNNSCTHSLVFPVTTTQGLGTGPLYTMNFASGSNPNQTGILGCDGGTSGNNERQDIANGCQGTYAINTSDYPACVNLANSGPSPWDCLPGNSGIKEGPFFQGLQQRMEPTGSCTNFNNYPAYQPNDPRIVSLFVVPYNSVASGVKPLPIVNLAAFYVTGWDSSKDPCAKAVPPDDPAGKDQVVGHFINYVNPNGTSGNGQCVQGSLTECVAILTR